MYKVTIQNKFKELPYVGRFETEQEAKEWLKNHKSKGKDSYQITSPEKDLAGAKTIKKVKGPMGMELWLHEFPAEYTAEIVKEQEDYSQAKKKFEEIRQKRNELLRDTDYTQLADAPMDSNIKKRYRDYRKYLRDLPSLLDDKIVLTYKIKTFEEFNSGV